MDFYGLCEGQRSWKSQYKCLPYNNSPISILIAQQRQRLCLHEDYSSWPKRWMECQTLNPATSMWWDKHAATWAIRGQQEGKNNAKLTVCLSSVILPESQPYLCAPWTSANTKQTQYALIWLRFVCVCVTDTLYMMCTKHLTFVSLLTVLFFCCDWNWLLWKGNVVYKKFPKALAEAHVSGGSFFELCCSGWWDSRIMYADSWPAWSHAERGVISMPAYATAH